MDTDIVSTATKSDTFPMKEERKALVRDVNPCLLCILCGGYYVDATTIVECLHTYCRSCIVKFLQSSKFCPICDVQVHKTKPFLSLRSDAVMQRLVYKTIPGFYKNELLRRKQYSEKSDKFCSNDTNLIEEEYYFSPDEPISISLEYMEQCRTNNVSDIDEKYFDVCQIDENIRDQTTYKRYLQGPAALQIKHIHKFIKLKYNLKRSHTVEVFSDYTKLPSTFSLMDVAYTFSWKRDKPMRLRYQIFKSTSIKVPQMISEEISDELVSLKNDFVTSSVTSPNAVNITSSDHGETRCETADLESSTKTKLNLKRKSSNVFTKKSTIENLSSPSSPPNDVAKHNEPDDYELLVKIPRISNTKQLKDIIKAETCNESKISTSQNTTENCKMKQSDVDDQFNDDYVKYEQDIEEVDDDDDDDDDDADRLRISQLSEEDTNDKTEDPQLVIDTSDLDNTKEEEEEEEEEDEESKSKQDEAKKSAKYKRKSKKSKHHHHHKHHHHRHHERKKAGPQATILHSPDSDIMKLKLKLNNVQPDVKYHKQSRRKRKKSPESYFSPSYSSSNSSVSGSSPDTHSVSRTDDDSLHSHISEFSAESVDTNCFKEEPNSTTKNNMLPSPSLTPASSKNVNGEQPVADKHRSPTSKEKLLQMRAFRPKNIAAVKSEEVKDKGKDIETKTKNDSNNNDSVFIPASESKEKPKVTAAPILRPPSSITVSKITAAEKLKMEQEKLLLMNGSKDDKPSLEIMLVNGPPSFTKQSSPVSSTTSSAADTTAKPNKTIRPLPAAIPLKHFQKLKSNETLSKPSPTPRISISPQKTAKPSPDGVKQATHTRLDGMKRSVTVSLSGNPFDNAFSGALDLSSKPIKNSLTLNVAQSLLNKKPCMNGGIRSTGPSSYSPVKSMASLAENARPFHKLSTAQFTKASYPPSLSSAPKNQKLIPLQTSSKTEFIAPTLNGTCRATSKTTNIPKLNEIKIGPVSSTTETPPKPGQNQTVRNIPNPSFLLQRHHASINKVSSSNDISIKISKTVPSAVVNQRITSNACSLNNLKKNGEKCPSSAIPLNAYLDNSNIMTTK